jgi:ribulose-phosphate 3-epimerase
MMCVPLAAMESTLRVFEQTGVEYLHMDVMDGHFVPNFMLGTDFIKQMRAMTSIPLDIHLMIEKPEDKLDWFDVRPNEFVSFHCEATRHPQRICASIREIGAKPMIALNPATPLVVLEDLLPDLDGVLLMGVNPGFAGQKLIPQVIDKIRRLRRMLDEKGFQTVCIQVDGNTSEANVRLMAEAGADFFVAGTAGLFMPGYDLTERVNNFRNCMGYE